MIWHPRAKENTTQVSLKAFAKAVQNFNRNLKIVSISTNHCREF